MGTGAGGQLLPVFEPGEPRGDRYGQWRQAANRAIHLRHRPRA